MNNKITKHLENGIEKDKAYINNKENDENKENINTLEEHDPTSSI